jgi:hypothetical protein
MPVFQSGDVADWVTLIIELVAALSITIVVWLLTKDLDFKNEKILNKLDSEQHSIAASVKDLQNIESNIQKIISKENEARIERKKYALDKIGLEIQGIVDDIRNLETVRKNHKFRTPDQIKVNQEHVEAVSRILYRKEKLRGFMINAATDLSLQQSQYIPNIWIEVDPYVNTTDPNDERSNPEALMFAIKSVARTMSDYPWRGLDLTKNLMLTLPWMKCENCGEFPGFEAASVDPKLEAVCEKCGHRRPPLKAH